MSSDIRGQPSEPFWRRWLLPIAVVLFLASTAWNVGTRIQTQTTTTSSVESTCEAVNGVQKIVSTILIRSESISLKHPSPEFSEAQVRAYYDRALKELQPAKC